MFSSVIYMYVYTIIEPPPALGPGKKSSWGKNCDYKSLLSLELNCWKTKSGLTNLSGYQLAIFVSYKAILRKNIIIQTSHWEIRRKECQLIRSFLLSSSVYSVRSRKKKYAYSFNEASKSFMYFNSK